MAGHSSQIQRKPEGSLALLGVEEGLRWGDRVTGRKPREACAAVSSPWKTLSTLPFVV